MADGKISMAPESLSMHDQLRLIEIAHETGDHDLKKVAMCLLHMAQKFSYIMVSNPQEPRPFPECQSLLYFILGEQKIAIHIKGSGYEVYERRGDVDFAARQVSITEWHNAFGAK